ncbi:hypothetical protein [Methanobrevibacter sp.]|uniref:hypothetical protein n=1 Tax=Methanobrevibacter sp. TaxID=66852 RepID=UPI003867125D
MPNLTYVFYQFQETAATFQNTKEKPYKSLSIKGQTYQNILPEPTTPVLTNNAEMFSVDEGLDETIEIVDGVAKSAILKGQTLVNCINLKTKWFSSETNLKTDSPTDVELSQYQRASLDVSMLKSNQKYYVLPIVDYTMTNGVNSDVFLQLNTMISNSLNALFRIRFNTLAKPTIITTGELTDLSKSYIFIAGKSCELNIRDIKIMLIEYQDGMENWDIPYFEGMQSVKMPVLTTTGKNLFDGGDFYTDIIGNSATGNCELLINGLKIKKNTEYVISFKYETDTDRPSSYYCILTKTKQTFDNHNMLYSYVQNNPNDSINKTTLSFDSGDFEYLYLSPTSIASTVDGYMSYSNIQVEKGSTSTTYEPYKSNILTVNEPVELRGIGDVKDELNLTTGELTERICEVVLDGTNIELYNTTSDFNNDNFYSVYCYPSNRQSIINIISDKFKKANSKTEFLSIPSIYIFDKNKGQIVISFEKNKLSENSINGVKEFLQQNPLTIQYQLATPTIKTVDLSVVDQDNTVTDLHFFKDGHIIQSSGADTSLIPTLDYQAKTSNSYVMDLMKSNTIYTMKSSTHNGGYIYIDGKDYTMGLNRQFTSPSSMTNKLLVVDGVIDNFMILEGDLTSKTIPYFKGIKSAFEGEDRIEVLSTGKNLTKGVLSNVTDRVTFELFELINGKTYTHTLTNYNTDGARIDLVSTTGDSYIIRNWGETKSTFTVPDDGVTYNKISFWKSGLLYDENTMTFQLEEGSIATSYEPYKSNTLTVNEEVELRGVGDVQDELNLLTGELTQRIGEVVLNGSEKSWGASGLSNQNETIIFQMNTGIDTHIPHPEPHILPISPEMRSNNDTSADLEGILKCQGTDGHGFYVRINRNRLETEDVLGFKTWLSKNPLTVRYQLETESIKTVDLTIQDQDGNEIPKPKSYYEVTHFSINSLIPPIVEVEVQTFNQEDLETLSDTIDEIENQQDKLMTTSEEQEDGVQSVMLGLTEIFEESEEV